MGRNLLCLAVGAMVLSENLRLDSSNRYEPFQYAYKVTVCFSIFGRLDHINSQRLCAYILDFNL